MRATASISPARTGKQRLLGSCAIAAGMAALTLGGPALAQVQGTGQVVVGPTLGTATITNNPPAKPNTTQVVAAGSQTIINWTPTDTAQTGLPIDFLPATNTLEFYGTGQYTVLNRFIAVDPLSGLNIPISRQIALNGTVNSYVGSPAAGTSATQGGNIWFYNAGGILIGARAAINVGSLVLTANDIDTTGGLYGSNNEIRFRGAAGSTSAIEIAGQSFIGAANPGNPGSSYVALVAPRIAQAGIIDVDGSAALVAAEQADIIINNGLFNINVLVGAEGGNVITHTGITGGPAHQQGDADQNRVYMVAIPKNDAVTMLVSGQVGYQDAVVAQTDPDGAVVLSAGYNVVNGALAAAPVNATAANITVNDTIFQSSVTARASGAFVGQPVGTIPTGGPLPSVPPPHIGRLIVQGDATFIGDASASLTVGTGQLVGATGNLTVTSGGVAGQPGSASVASNGGQMVAAGNLTITGGGAIAADGSAQGGDAALSITGGAVLVGGNVAVNANGVGGIGVSGAGGTGTGGNASIDVSNPGGTLTADSVTANARGIGGGLIRNPLGIVTGAVGVGGDGQGGTATIAAQNGGSINVTTGLTANADGIGQTGTTQSGNGTGGTARIDILGESTVVGSPLTTASAAGLGGGTFSGPLGTILSLAGGDGQGGTAILNIGADSAASVGLGTANVVADGTGGGAGGGENASGGNGTGGNATVLADNGVTANFAALAVTAIGQGGGGTSPSGLAATSGDGVGGTVTVRAANGSSLLSLDTIILDATGLAVVSNHVGSGTGGDIVVTASSGGLVSANGEFQLIAPGGSRSTTISRSSGSGTGGDIDLTADGGTIRAGFYSGTANAGTANSSGASGAAQGGTIDLLATNAGTISATNTDRTNIFSADALTGRSGGGASATGGTVHAIADGGTIGFNGSAQFYAGGVSGGDVDFGTTAVPMGMGGTVLIQLMNGGTMSFTDLLAGASGSSSVTVEALPGIDPRGAATGQGGDLTIDIQGGTFTAANLTASADGIGGNANGSGQGGTIAYSQTGGTVTIDSLSVTANALGGRNDAGTGAGTGTGGNATIDLIGGTLNVTNLSAEAMGMGGFGTTGFDAGLGRAAGAGGDGIGGTATINLNGTAVVTAQSVNAGAAGAGGFGGEFVATTGIIGSSGDGGAGNGGTAIVNLTAGTLTTGSLSADAGGFGGSGGNLINSSSSVTPTGTSVGGHGGNGQGGTATIVFSTPVTATGTVGSYAVGFGGIGGDNERAGNGGDGTGGNAGLVVDDLALGTVGAIANAEALGGTGGNASFGLGGAGGSGGNAAGGTARLTVQGPNGSAGINPAALAADGTGGDAGGGDGTGPTGNGGNGTGGTVELLALDGTLTLVPFSSGPMSIRSSGNGGTGTTDGDGTGGTINLFARGGAITSGGNPVAFLVDGIGGTTQGGTIRLSSETAPGGAGSIQLADTTMNANGDRAGRIEISTDTSIALTSLDAQATGTAAPTNNDTNVAPAGIFLAATGGTIATDGAMTLNTGSSVGVYAQGDGQVSVGGSLTVTANDQVDIRHDLRAGTAPTIQTSGGLSITAANSISGAPGSLLSAGTAMLLNATNGTIGVDSLDAQDVIQILAPNGNITVAGTATSNDIVVNGGFGVDIANATANDDLSIIGNALTLGRLTTNGTGADSELDGSNIFLGSQGAATVVHAEADNDFTAQVGSFSTGLNSIITGGDISVIAPGAIDLGNSTAGGSVSAQGSTIAFNTVDAGTTVGLSANGGGLTDGINGVNIDAGDDITLTGRFVNVSGNTTSTDSLFALATDSTANFGLADVDGNIAIVANTDLTGTYRSGGNINLNANNNLTAEADAAGGYVTNSVTSEGYVFAVANNGTATLTDSSAATMMGVRAGTVGTITNATAGEDILLIAGSTANVTNAVAGDDLTVDATCCIVIANASTTGLGVDSRTLVFAPGSAGGPGFFQTQATPPNESNVTLTASAGTVDATDVVAFDNFTANATGVATTTGTIRSGQATTITGSSLALEAITAGTDILLTSNSGGITATGLLQSGADTTASGASLNLRDITAGGDVALTSTSGDIVTVGDITSSLGSVSLTATGGAVSTTGTIDAARDILIATTGGGSFDRLIAGDDIDIGGSGDIDVAFMAATGDNPDSGETGSNVTITLAGNAVVDHAEAAGDFTADVTSFRTGLNSIITGGDIAITALGAADLGNSTAGGSIGVAAQSIAFATLDAGEFVNLNATGTAPGAEGIAGTTILAAGDVFLTGNSITVGSIDAGGRLSAFGSGGDVAIANAVAASNIGVLADGDIGGSYSAGGDIELSAGGNIAATANAAGGAPDPSNSDVNTAGNVFVDADGNVTLSNSGAAGMFGVNAGGSATLTNVTAGEDMLVLAGTTASLSGITVGDDLVARAAGAVTATGASATGAGPDGFLLDFTTSGFTIGQGEGVSSVDGADISLRSTGGSVTAAGLSAGDDIILNAGTALSVSGATTRGIGQTGGDSSIRTQSGSGTFAGLNAFSDIAINASGAVAVTAPATAGRDIGIAAASVDVASLATPAGTLIDGLAAGRNLQLAANGAITGGAVRAAGNLELVAGTTIDIERAATGAGGSLALDGAAGVTADLVAGGGATSLASTSGAIEIGSLSSTGPVDASGDSILIGGGSGNLIFTALNADVGDASVTTSGNLTITAGTVAGRATLRSTNGDLGVTQLGAANVQLGSDDDMTLGNVTASNSLLGEAGGVLTVNGAVTAREISFGSADIAIAANGRLGTAGTTEVLDVRNTDDDSQTFIGGTGTRGGYHIDAAEMARLYGTDIRIFAPQVENNNGGFLAAAPGGLPIGSVGSSAQPDVVIDDFTMTAGGATSNLGANGTLTIETPGKARVIGDVLFTGMGDNNGLAIRANNALEVILGEGTIRLTGASSSSGGTSTPGGLLTLASDDVIVATASAIADVRDAADIDAIDDRLAMNDGVTSDDGALFAGGIDVDVINGFYVQNSGTGTRFAERRGLTFGALGLNVNVEGSGTRIVLNGVHLGPSGQVTGLDAIPLLSIDGFVIGSGPLSGSGLAFDSGSTMNGCLIVSSTTCAFLEFESSFPVQDVINDDDDDGEEGDGDDAEGMSLPVPLITMRDLDPLTGEPLLDDPVTGAGNDDLWTPPSE